MTLTQERRDELRRNSERMMGSCAVIAPYSISPQEVLALLNEAECARINLSMAEANHDWCANANCDKCNRRLAAERQSYDDLAASGGIVDAP